jgi:hypothetical protein
MYVCVCVCVRIKRIEKPYLDGRRPPGNFETCIAPANQKLYTIKKET